MDRDTVIVKADMRDVVEQWGPGRSPDDGEPDQVVVDTAQARYYEVREISRDEALSKGFKE